MEIGQHIDTLEDYSLISKDTPLISNLNMLENIALIKEVHELLSIEKAENIAKESLEKIGLSHIGLNRLNQCSSLEVFYVMFIRALMSRDMNVIITTPFSLISNLRDIQPILDNIEILNTHKNIFIFDNITNKSHYEGSSCPIVK